MSRSAVAPQLQRCKAELDSSLPPPLDSVVLWLQRVETVLREDGGEEKDHLVAAKEARVQQDTLKVTLCLMKREQICPALKNKKCTKASGSQKTHDLRPMGMDMDVFRLFTFLSTSCVQNCVLCFFLDYNERHEPPGQHT